MYGLRRFGLRALSVRSAFPLAGPAQRNFASLALPIARRPIQRSATLLLLQKRFLSDEASVEFNAAPQEEANASVDTPATNDPVQPSAAETSVPPPVDNVSAAPMSNASAPINNAAQVPINNYPSGRYGNDSAYPQQSFRRVTRSRRQPNPPKRSVYVGNLNFDATEDQLRDLFRDFNPLSVHILTDNRGFNRGFGYVEFSSVDLATRAIGTFDQRVFLGRTLLVNYAIADAPASMQTSPNGIPQSSPSSVLFIGNIPFNMTDQDLTDLFRNISNVTDVRVAVDRQTGRPRGFAHADFTDVDSAVRAMKKLRDVQVYGRNLRVDFSVSKPRAEVDPRFAMTGRSDGMQNPPNSYGQGSNGTPTA